MSYTALQRVVVRMLFDPPFIARVYADPERALTGVDLSPAERRWLVTPDRRAYGVDVYRRSRALAELLREFPVSAALIIRAGLGIARLDPYFSTAGFHARFRSAAPSAAASAPI